jgi:hypothetical protein
MTRLTALSCVAFGLAAAALAACSAGARKPEATATMAPPLSGRPDDLRERIRALDAEIAQQLETGDLEAPDATAAAAMGGTSMAEVRTTCEHVPSQRCDDVCKLSGSICDNATAICELADQLPGDAWASERCGAAKASCQRASERCCAGECAATP